MATRKGRTWRLTNRGKIVILLFITLVALLVTFAVERSQAASPSGPVALATESAPATDRPFTRGHRPCTDPLVTTLRRAGFTGRNLREAWAIAMRESHGQADLVSYGVDHGLFQFNIDAHRDKHWWNVEKLLTADYNARIAYLTSQGGKDWLMWGLTGDGETDARMYPMWNEAKIYKWITKPFQRYFTDFMKLPRGCRG